MDEIGVLKNALREYEHAKHLKRMNQELYQHLTGSIYWLLKYSEKYNIPLPKKDELLRMVEKANFLIDQFIPPPKPQQPSKTPSDPTEPIIGFIYQIIP
jgi:hypothetical protein